MILRQLIQALREKAEHPQPLCKHFNLANECKECDEAWLLHEELPLAESMFNPISQSNL